MTDASGPRHDAVPPSLGGQRVAELVVAEEAPAGLEDVRREGLEIEARSLWKLTLRRFLRHRLAVTSFIVLVVICGAGIFADTVAPYTFDKIDLENSQIGPAFEGQHYFGTDQIGRDYFSRVVFGIRTTIRVAFLVAILSTLIGMTIGAIAGYFGGWIDNLLMRLTDLFLVLPLLPLLIVASAFLGEGSPFRVAVILAFLLWTTLARIVRGTFLSLKEKEFVESAKALGASDFRIIVRHMLPNAISPIIVNATLTVALAILLEAFLSFLGFGIQPPTPALGALIADGKGTMLTSWWLVVFPGATIVLICLCINFLGDGLRDALDPTQRRVRA